MGSCELCSVVRRSADPEFARRYGDTRSRIADLTSQVAIIPSIGSLGPVHALVLPTLHLRSIASTPVAMSRAIWSSVALLRHGILREGLKPIVLEHGLAERGGEGCGVDHAHVHVVAINADQKVSPPSGPWSEHIADRFAPALDATREYLLIGLADGSWLSRYQQNVESQFLRKWLAGELGQEQWDWRNAGADEDLPGQVARIRTLTRLPACQAA